MNPDKRAEMFRRFKQANPAPRTELNYDSPFELLIAVILSAQATDVSVNKATAKLFPVANTAAAIRDLGVEGITPYIRTIGLFNSKARNVVATCEMLCNLHGGEVPAQRDALEALPGVGRKTANVVLNTAFGELAMAVDTHIYRVSNRTGLAPGKTVLDVESKLMRRVPREYLLDAHHWLILHGRYVCLARTPRCPDCLISDLCDFKPKTGSEEAILSKKAGKNLGKKASKLASKKAGKKAGKKLGKKASKLASKKAVAKASKMVDRNVAARESNRTRRQAAASRTGEGRTEQSTAGDANIQAARSDAAPKEK